MPRTSVVTAAQRRSEAVAARLSRMELLTSRLVRGLVHGEYPTSAYGVGWERAEAREYHPGDDVRHLDWAATARTGALTVRATHAEREARVAIVVDGSASMAFGTRGLTKHETASCLAAALVQVTSAAGNPSLLAHAAAEGASWYPLPPSHGAAAPVLRLLTAAGSGPSAADDPQLNSLPGVLRRLGAPFGRNDLTVVLTDLHGTEWQPPLRALAATRPVVVVRITDRRERELVDVGDLTLLARGRAIELPTGDAALRARYRAAAATLAERRRRAVLSAGAIHVDVDADGDVDTDAVAVLRSLVRNGPHATSSHTVRSPDVAVR